MIVKYITLALPPIFFSLELKRKVGPSAGHYYDDSFDSCNPGVYEFPGFPLPRTDGNAPGMFRTIAIAAALTVSSPAFAWGPIGHRITGAIADENLSGVARANVRILLGVEDLAEAATWPDDMKSDQAEFWQKTASPWHYVTVREGDKYQASDAPPEGDAMTALQRFTAVLRDPTAPIDDKRLALRFIVHIIGDLHQPLHAGGGNDRGGNDFKVTWFGKPTNLHSVWDSALIEQRSLSYSEYADWLSRSIKPEELIAWSDVRPATWLSESIALRKTIYPAEPSISWDYAYRHRAELDGRLKRGGVRIAAYLNWVFESAAPPAEQKKRK